MLALLLTVLYAQAESSPMMIRFDSGGTNYAAPLVAKLTTNGQAVEVTLSDEGDGVDRVKGDGLYAAVSQGGGTKLELELTAGGRSLGKASAAFVDATAQYDLDITLAGGVLAVKVSAPPDPNGDGGSGAPAQGGGTPPEGGGTPLGGPGAGGGAGGGGSPSFGGSPGLPSSSKAPPVSFASGSSSDGVLFIAFGVGLLVLLFVVWLWLRAKSGPQGRTKDVTMVPEPGLFAPAFPSLSDGLSVWVAAGEAASIVQPLLAHLADRHRVLVVARAGAEVKPMAGGPVFRMVGARPTLVGDVADSLEQEPGPPLCLFLLLETASPDALRDYRDLMPTTLGGIVLLHSDVETALPKLLVTLDGAGWRLKHGEAEVRVGVGPRGLEALP